MSQGSGSAGGAGGGGDDGGGLDFQLPDEILSVIPADPYDQLDLARKITSMAIASRVTKLESEMGKMRQKLQDKDKLVFELEERLSRLQHANHEADSRLRIALDENVRLKNPHPVLFHFEILGVVSNLYSFLFFYMRCLVAKKIMEREEEGGKLVIFWGFHYSCLFPLSN